jgi:hypothetical protein
MEGGFQPHLDFDETRRIGLVLVFSPWFSAVLRGAEELRLNQLQAIGSHNSYHLAPPAGVLGVIGKFRKDAVDAWNYSHPRLGEQLSGGRVAAVGA